MDESVDISVNDDVSPVRSKEPASDLFSTLASQRRRHAIALLTTRDRAIQASELATLIVAWEHGQPPTAVTEEERQRTLLQLHHMDLPKLADAGLIDPDFDEGAITPTGDQAAIVSEVIGPGPSQESERSQVRTMICEILADDVRRALLSVLDERLGGSESPQEIGLETLADAVTRHAHGNGTDDVTPADHSRIQAALHHNHLPKLDEADILAYDPDMAAVEYAASAEFRQEWQRLNDLGQSSD